MALQPTTTEDLVFYLLELDKHNQLYNILRPLLTFIPQSSFTTSLDTTYVAKAVAERS